MRRLKVGDVVYLATDPRKAPGTVLSIQGGTVAVFWQDTGRRWHYADPSRLVRKAEH